MENGNNLPRKKNKKKKIRSNSPQTLNASEKVRKFMKYYQIKHINDFFTISFAVLAIDRSEIYANKLIIPKFNRKSTRNLQKMLRTSLQS
jgi:hypothetical protein